MRGSLPPLPPRSDVQQRRAVQKERFIPPPLMKNKLPSIKSGGTVKFDKMPPRPETKFQFQALPDFNPLPLGLPRTVADARAGRPISQYRTGKPEDSISKLPYKMDSMFETPLLTKGVGLTPGRRAVQKSRTGAVNQQMPLKPTVEYKGETLFSDHERIRNELKKVGFNVNKDIQNQLGKHFGPPPKLGRPKPDPMVKNYDDFEFDADHRNELKNIFTTKPVDKSFSGISKRIQEHRDEWRTLQSSSGKGSRTGGGRGSSYDKYSYNNQEESIKDTRTVVNEKLAEISHQFRESLRINSDPKKYIKTPKHGSINVHSLASKARAMLDSGDIGSGREFVKLDQDNFSSSNQLESLLLGRVGPRFYPRRKGGEQPQAKGRQTTATTVQTMSTTVRKPNPQQPPFSRNSSLQTPPSRRKQSFDSDLDFAGVMKLRSLLEANTSELFANKVNRGELDAHRRDVDPDYPHEPMEKFVGPPKNLDPYMLTRQIIREKQDRALAYDIETGRTKVDRVVDNPKKTVHISTDVQTTPRIQFAPPKISTDKIQEMLGDSVKSMDEAAKVANALGSLMTRVAASRIVGDNIQAAMTSNSNPNAGFPLKSILQNRGTPTTNRTMSTSSPYHREMNSGTESDHRSESENESQRGYFGSGSKKEIEIQTEVAQNYYSLKPSMPEIKFKRDMSEADQARLAELREKKKEWDAQLYKEVVGHSAREQY